MKKANLQKYQYINLQTELIFVWTLVSSSRRYSSREQVAMCDSGLVIVVLLTSFFVLVALQSIFYSFDYNCNNFYYDDVVGGGIHS